MPPDPSTEPPAWSTADDDEPPDPSPVDHPNVPDYRQQRLRPRPTPEAPTPGWQREPDDPDPPDGSGLRLDLPGLADLLDRQGLRTARPRVVLDVHLTDQTLATGSDVVRTDHADLGPMLATQLREFLIKHACHITLRPVLDADRVPAVDAYEIPQRIRDAVRLRHVASVFPYSGATSPRMDLDHTNPVPAGRHHRPDRTVEPRTARPQRAQCQDPRWVDCQQSPPGRLPLAFTPRPLVPLHEPGTQSLGPLRNDDHPSEGGATVRRP